MVLLVENLEKNIVRIKVNRPEKRNALDFEVIIKLVEELQKLKTSDTRCLIITGEGKHFCSGGDINDMIDRRGKAMKTKERLEAGLNQIVREIRQLRFPVLAAVNGACFGAGLVIATACDLIYCDSSAKFGFAHGNIGLIPEGAYFLTNYLGLLKAKEYVFLRKVMTSDEAMSYGFINNIYQDSELQNSVFNIAVEIAQGPQKTLGLAKEVLNHAFENNLETHLKYESLAQGAAFTTEEHTEGVNAFLEKRTPEFNKT